LENSPLSQVLSGFNPDERGGAKEKRKQRKSLGTVTSVSNSQFLGWERGKKKPLKEKKRGGKRRSHNFCDSYSPTMEDIVSVRRKVGEEFEKREEGEKNPSCHLAHYFPI